MYNRIKRHVIDQYYWHPEEMLPYVGSNLYFNVFSCNGENQNSEEFSFALYHYRNHVNRFITETGIVPKHVCILCSSSIFSCLCTHPKF